MKPKEEVDILGNAGFKASRKFYAAYQSAIKTTYFNHPKIITRLYLISEQPDMRENGKLFL